MQVYDRAVVTIVDAQLTSLIAAIVLFGIGDWADQKVLQLS